MQLVFMQQIEIPMGGRGDERENSQGGFDSCELNPRVEGADEIDGSGAISDRAGFHQPCGRDRGGAKETELAVDKHGPVRMLPADKFDRFMQGGLGDRHKI